ncbi:DNA-directed RNA polymerase III subunit RPC7-like [Oscarella lobularis]|uniref:DNA-directed RNA polymerase III subunit RPC7-like n=1 Tax=Oscarella lobularis TaxID=121494 RepID=UPI003313AE9F
MAGRGKRGKSQISQLSDSLGVRRGDLPPPPERPPPLYPPLEFQPCPLHELEADKYMLTVKQQMRSSMQGLPYFVRPALKKADVERFSDRLHAQSHVSDQILDWKPDWRFFPKELKMKTRDPESSAAAINQDTVRPRIDIASTRKRKKERTSSSAEETFKRTKVEDEVQKKLEILEEKGDKDEQKREDESAAEADDYDEEEEEETDYNIPYFDNGEDYIGFEDEDGLEDGASYY